MYTFSYPCPQCAGVNQAQLWDAGRSAVCPYCRADHLVPVPKEMDRPSRGDDPPIRFDCPRCGRHFAAKPLIRGKKIRCGGCGKGVYVPEKSGQRARKPKQRSGLPSQSSGRVPILGRKPRKPRKRPETIGSRPLSLEDDIDDLLGSVSAPTIKKAERPGGESQKNGVPITPVVWFIAGTIAATLAIVLSIRFKSVF